jgi:hypothetical protein
MTDWPGTPVAAAPDKDAGAQWPGIPVGKQDVDLGRVARQGVSGINEGLADVVGKPIDALSNLMSQPGALIAHAVTGEPVAPMSHLVENAIRGAGGPNDVVAKALNPERSENPADYEPQNRPERMARAGGEVVGQTLPITTGVIGAGNAVRAAAPVAEKAAGVIGRFIQSLRGAGSEMADTAAAAPVRTAVADAVGGATAGAGGELGKEVAPEYGMSPETGALAGTVGGSIAPFAAPMLYPGAWVERLLLPYLKPATSAALKNSPIGSVAAEKLAADRQAYVNREGKYANPDELAPPEPSWIQKQLVAGADMRGNKAATAVQKEFDSVTGTPEAQAKIAAAQELENRIPGLKLTVAQQTGDPALLNKQADIEAKATGDELRTLQGRYGGNQAAVDEFMRGRAPAPEAPVRPGQMGPNQQDTFPEQSVTRTAQGRVDRAQAATQQQIDAVNQELERRSAALPEIDRAATGETLRNARTGAQQAADAEVNRLRGNIAAPNTPVQVGVDNDGQPIMSTVNNVLNRRTAINQELRDYNSASARNIDDVRRMRALNAERNHLDGVIEDVNLPGMQEYRSFYRDTYAPQFLEGASRDVGRYDQFGYGKNKVADENVAGKFFGPNDISAARQFNQTLGHDPEARQAMFEYALDDLRHAAIDPNTGILRPGAVNRWLAKNERVLNEMPEIRDAVTQYNPDDLYARLGQLRQRQEGIGNSTVARTVDQEPGKAIDSALADWRVARTLKRSVANDPQADAALTHAVWERVTAANSPDQLQGYVEKNRRALNELLTPEHIADLEATVKARRLLDQTPKPEGVAGKAGNIFDKFSDITGTSVPTLATTATTLSRGRSNPVYEGGRLIVNAVRKQAQAAEDRMTRDMLYSDKRPAAPGSEKLPPKVDSRSLAARIFNPGDQPPRLNTHLVPALIDANSNGRQ